jgi:hypothetical protein
MRAAAAAGVIAPDRSEIISMFEDGWSVRALRTAGDFRREGVLMSNCVASYVYADLDDGDLFSMHDRPDLHRNQRTMRLVSLRDECNLPHATAWLADDESGKRDLFFCLGYHNSAIKPQRPHAQRLMQWCDHMGAGWHGSEHRHDPNTVMLSEMFTMLQGAPMPARTHSRLPAHLVAPSHARRIEHAHSAFGQASALIAELGRACIERPDRAPALMPLQIRADLLLDNFPDSSASVEQRAAITQLGHDVVELIDQLDAAESAAHTIAA